MVIMQLWRIAIIHNSIQFLFNSLMSWITMNVGENCSDEHCFNLFLFRINLYFEVSSPSQPYFHFYRAIYVLKLRFISCRWFTIVQVNTIYCWFLCIKNLTYSVYVILTCNQCLTRETNIMAIILLIILPLRNTRWTILNTYMLYVLTALLHAQLCACVEVSLNMCFLASRDPLQLQPNTKIFYSGENHHAQKTKKIFLIRTYGLHYCVHRGFSL